MRTFAAQRMEGAVQLAQRLSRANSLQYRFAYRKVTVNALEIEPLLVPLLVAAGARGIAFHVLHQ